MNIRQPIQTFAHTAARKQAAPAQPGPDDVPDEFENRRDYGNGPDDVYDEYDNGRQETYSGPDGTYSYDPY